MRRLRVAGVLFFVNVLAWNAALVVVAQEKEPKGPLKVTAEKGSIRVEYRVEKVPELKAGEVPLVVVFVTSANGPTLDEAILKAKPRSAPKSANVSVNGYLTAFVDVATDEKPAREGFLFQTQALKNEVAEKKLQHVVIRMPYKKSDPFDRDFDLEWLEQNGFSWERIGAEAKVSAAMVANKGGSLRPIVPVSTAKVKVGE